MNKNVIKNFAIWARNKLIADIQYKAGLMGITADGMHSALPQSTKETEFYDIGTAKPYAITGEAVKQRRSLVDAINQKASETSYQTAYKYIMESVAYTWFNRLIAIRFMEINDYLPSHIRVLSSDSGKMEPDLVTTPFDADLTFTEKEKQEIVRLKNENHLDECFRLLFIKQCNALNEILPALFEKTADYTELLLNISAIDKEGVVYHLVNDISEDDFNIEKGGQVEIIGWLYQYYNTEPKNEAFAKNGKITKEEIPAVTQLFTPDWIVRYMVENSLGRLWVEGHPNDLLKSKWKYYLDEAEQEPEVQEKLDEIHKEYAKLTPEEIRFIDPCMGSGHILVYAFDVLMQIYESAGYSQRDAAQSILENNLNGLDIDDRAYQMAYFAVMMKARQYNRRILSAETACHVYSIQESNHINRNQLTYFGVGFSDVEKNDALNQMGGLLDTFKDAKEYGSILHVEDYDWELLRRFVENVDVDGQMTFDTVGLEQTREKLRTLIDIGEVMARKYDVVVTNPPYMALSSASANLYTKMKKDFPISRNDLYMVFIERGSRLTKYIGLQAMITQHTWMFLSRSVELREKMLQSDIINMVHLGTRAFDEIGGEIVQTVAFVLRRCNTKGYLSKFDRLVDYLRQEDKRKAFLTASDRYIQSKEIFDYVPGRMYIYWQTDNFIKNFEEHLVGDKIDTRVGLDTGNNEKYIRVWQEVVFNNILFSAKVVGDVKIPYKWVPHTKGGAYRKWYGNFDYVLAFDETSYNELLSTGNHLPSRQFYFLPGITWSRISTNNFAVRYTPSGMVFNSACPTAFAEEDTLMYALGLLNTKIVNAYVMALSPTMNFQAGDIDKIPFIVKERDADNVRKLVKVCIELSKNDYDSFETSWDFIQHPLVELGKKSKERTNKGEWQYRIEDAFFWWNNECENRFSSLKANEEELNRIFIEIYGLQDELTPEVEDKDVTVRKADLQRDIKSLISYIVGCMFGRYSPYKPGLIYAGGDWERTYGDFPIQSVKLEPEKYQHGTFFYTYGYPIRPYSEVYLRDMPEIDDAPDFWGVSGDNIIPISDEEYFENDIITRFAQFVEIVYGEETLEENLDFIAKALGNKGNTSREIIRNYFLNDFFKDHCKVYQKRPIYWLFDSGKQNGFKALIYLHRYNADTIGNLRVDYLHRMQRVYESEIERMQDMIDHSMNSREVGAATKRREKLQKQLKECRDYDEKVGHLALSRIELDLDDGVKVNYRKVQTARDGRFYEVLADSKSIVAKEK